MESGGDWPNIYDAASDSSSASVESNMSTSASKSSNDDLGECLTSTSDAMATRSGAILTSVSALEDRDYHQVGPMLMSPPADASPDPTGEEVPPLPEFILVTRVSGPACTGCKSSSPAVANCFSCSALLCANCVIAHQLMVAFEVSKSKACRGHKCKTIFSGSSRDQPRAERQ